MIHVHRWSRSGAAMLLLLAALALLLRPSGGPVGGFETGAPTGRSGRTFGELDAADRAGILAAWHTARAAGDGRLAFTNPGHGFDAVLAVDGVTARLDGGVALRLSSPALGRDGVLVGLDGEEPVGAGTAEVTVARHAGDIQVTEWWRNNSGGLEQGFTVMAPPAGDGPLRLRQAWSSTLAAHVSADGSALVLSRDGRERLRFAGLRAWDAEGRTLPARMALDGPTLTMIVDDHRATYPVYIDPTLMQAYVKASNTEAGDQFGFSVAISGDTAVVGANLEDSSAAAVDGNAADNGASGSGAAFVFVRNAGTWSQQAYLKPNNTGGGDNFGLSVAISGDTIVVGAPYEDSSAAGVNGNGADDSLSNAGAAYVFARTGVAWAQQAYLKASNPGNSDFFGWSLAIDGNTVVVGASSEDSSAAGVDGNQADNGALNSGAAYVFTRSGATWSQQAYLKASNTGANDAFSFALAISGDTIVAGAHDEDSTATGINGDGSNNGAADAGAAYVFTRSGATWSQQAYLKASNTAAGDFFGYALAVSGDTIVVGASGEDSSAAGINGDQTSNAFADAGAAYVFVRSGTSWTQQAYLKASMPGIGDQFGIGVGIAGDLIVVGSPAEDSSSPGVNGLEADAGAPNSGAAYVFARTGSTWVQHAYLKANNPDTSDWLGQGVAISGDTVIAGAAYEDSVATGVGGAPFNNLAVDSGASYIFVMDVPTVTGVGPASGDTAGGTSVTITGTKFTATPGVLIGGAAATGVTWVNATTLTATTPPGAAGAATVVVTNPDGLPGTGVGLFSYAAPAPPDEGPGTGPLLPTVSTLDPVAVSESGAGLSATVQGGDDATAVFFEVSRSPLFADSVIHLPEQVTRTALGLTVATLNLDALLPGTTYFVRATAMTPSGPVSGAVRTLTTKPSAQPAVTPAPAAPALPVGVLAAPPAFSPGGLAQAVFTGGTVGQLERSVTDAGAAGAWLQDGEGAFVLFIVGGGAVNAPFAAAFPDGFPSAVPLVLVAP